GGWDVSRRPRGSLDLLGASTRRALEAIAAGASIEDAGRSGTTNGAAMRITPVGVATPSGDPGLLVDRVVAASRVTHNTGIALAVPAAAEAAGAPRKNGASGPGKGGEPGPPGGRAPAPSPWGPRGDAAPPPPRRPRPSP